ncbi:MAG: tetratricopeptide repeat protein, partial [Sediminispirochaetaceae bacterium]
KYYRRLLSIDREIGSLAAIAEDLREIGWILIDNDLYEESLPYYQEALELTRAAGNHRDESIILANIAAVHLWRGEQAEAIDPYRESIALAESLEMYDEAAISYRMLGKSCKELDRRAEAMKCFQAALALDERLGNKGRLAFDEENIGLLYWGDGRYQEALERFQRALTLNEELERSSHIYENLSELGRVHTKLGEYERALEYHRRALALAEELGSKPDIADSLDELGNVYEELGTYDTAMQHFRDALAIAEETGDDVARSRYLTSIGIVYHNWGQNRKSLEYYQQAYAIDKQLGRIMDIAVDLNNLGTVYVSLDQDDRAMECFLQALSILEEQGKNHELPLHLNNLGYIYAQKTMYDQAEECFTRAIQISNEIGDRKQYAFGLGMMGMLEKKQGRYDDALDYYTRALQIEEELNAQSDIAVELNEIGICCYNLDRYREAARYFQDSLDIKKQLRLTAKGKIRRDYLESELHTYQWLVSARIHTGEYAQAFETIESSAAQYLLEKLSGAVRDTAVEFSGLESFRRTLGPRSAAVSFANINWGNSVRIVVDRENIYGVRVHNSDLLEHVNNRHEQAINRYFVGLRGIHIESDEPEMQEISEGNLEEIITYYRMLVTNPVESPEQEEVRRFIAAELYTFLFKDIEQYLQDKDTLIIRPDGVLAFLPFETLIMPDGSYLVERYHIKYTQSFTVSELIAGREYRQDRRPLLALGGAVYGGTMKSGSTGRIAGSRELEAFTAGTLDGLSRGACMRSAYDALGYAAWQDLPGSMFEVKSIQQIVPGSTVFTGGDVSELNLKKMSCHGDLKDFRVLHFATHGLVVPELPELSSLVLSQTPDTDGDEDDYLTMLEIGELELEADFVNLSACETGLGKIYGGEGVVGLTQAFLIAGANGLSVSLWQVADESTARFMTGLYREASEQHIGYDEAITQMKRSFIAGGGKYAHPFFWAPFVYYGK